MDENYTKLAYREGEIHGISLALQLATLQKEAKGDLDYLIANLQELLEQE